MTAIRRCPPAFVAIVLTFALVACGSSARSGAPASTTPSGSTGSTPNQTASSAVLAGQTQTEWGRIWQGLPHGFPIPTGSTPDEETATPASAVLVVKGVGAQDISTFLQTELEKAGYTVVGSAEPLEDGSVVLDMTGTPDGCALQVKSTPTGGLTTVTIMYGASCPFG